MNQNKSANALHLHDGFILTVAAIAAGLLTGIIGYLIGQYFYIIILFPFILLVIGIFLFLPAIKFFKTSSFLVNALYGLLMGLMIFITFHYAEYYVFRSETAKSIQAAQHIDQQAAVDSIESFIQKKTGSNGFLGFLKLQASQSQGFVYYVTQKNRITNTLHLTLFGIRTYLYWVAEGAVILGGSFLLGLFAAGNPFRRKQPVSI